MRKDMDKVLVTTPRIGSNMKNREVKEARRSARESDYDNLPRYSSMKPKSRHWDDRKQLNEYLKPLVRFLAKNCNRPWNKVYSEICKNMDRRGIVQDHIFQHLFDYVELNPVLENGKPHSIGYGGLYRLYKTGWTFYVDKHGVLKEPRERRPPWKTAEDNPNIIKTKDNNVFIVKRENDGVWFRVEYSSPIERKKYSPSTGELHTWKDTPNIVNPKGLSLPNIPGMYPSFCKTLSKKEKKFFGVK
jgi:hypothetical protein